jgi:hypothetical protein
VVCFPDKLGDKSFYGLGPHHVVAQAIYDPLFDDIPPYSKVVFANADLPVAGAAIMGGANHGAAALTCSASEQAAQQMFWAASFLRALPPRDLLAIFNPLP